MPHVSRNPRLLWLAVALSIIVSGAAFLNALDDKTQQVDSAVVDAKDAEKTKDAVVSDASTLAQQVTHACLTSRGQVLKDLRAAGLCKQAEETKETIDDATDDGTPAPVVGPSQAQVNSAVRDLLSRMNLTGPRGATGPRPTEAQIAAAFADYCTTNVCQGPPGSAGAPGTDGTDAPIITSSYCDDSDHIVLVFSNDTRVVVSGSDCRGKIVGR